MKKTILAIVFSIIFVSFTLVPSILSIVDDTYNISLLISSSEEEEKKGEEKIKDLKIKALSREKAEYVTFSKLARLLSTHSENYSSLFKELISPPPERI